METSPFTCRQCGSNEISLSHDIQEIDSPTIGCIIKKTYKVRCKRCSYVDEHLYIFNPIDRNEI